MYVSQQVPDGATVTLVSRQSKQIHHDSHDYIPGESESHDSQTNSASHFNFDKFHMLDICDLAFENSAEVIFGVFYINIKIIL